MTLLKGREPTYISQAREAAEAAFDLELCHDAAVLSEAYERTREDYDHEKREYGRVQVRLQNTAPTRRISGGADNGGDGGDGGTSDDEDGGNGKIPFRGWDTADQIRFFLFFACACLTLFASGFAGYAAWEASGFEVIESTNWLGLVLALVIPCLALFAEYVQSTIDTDTGRKRIKMVLIGTTTAVAVAYIVSLQPMLSDVVNNSVSADDLDMLFNDGATGGDGDPLMFLLQIMLESLLGSIFMTACWDLLDQYRRSYEGPNPAYVRLQAMLDQRRKRRDRAAAKCDAALAALNQHFAARTAAGEAGATRARQIHDLESRLDQLKKKD